MWTPTDEVVPNLATYTAGAGAQVALYPHVLAEPPPGALRAGGPELTYPGSPRALR
jgi:hypothetical protein